MRSDRKQRVGRPFPWICRLTARGPRVYGRYSSLPLTLVWTPIGRRRFRPRGPITFALKAPPGSPRSGLWFLVPTPQIRSVTSRRAGWPGSQESERNESPGPKPVPRSPRAGTRPWDLWCVTSKRPWPCPRCECHPPRSRRPWAKPTEREPDKPPNGCRNRWQPRMGTRTGSPEMMVYGGGRRRSSSCPPPLAPFLAGGVGGGGGGSP